MRVEEFVLHLGVVREGIEDCSPRRIKTPQNPPMVNGRSFTRDVESDRRIGGFQANEGTDRVTSRVGRTVRFVIVSKLPRSEMCESTSGVWIVIPGVNVVVENLSELLSWNTVELLEIGERDFEQFLIWGSTVPAGEGTKSSGILRPSVTDKQNTRSVGAIDSVGWVDTNTDGEIGV